MDKMASIEFAINNEKKEMDYYLSQAAKSKNNVVKLLFETLAEDEKEHMEKIKNLHKKLIADGSWPEDIPIEVAGTEIVGKVGELMKKAGKVEKTDNEDIDALKKAAQGEEVGAQFYTDLAAKCTNEKEKTFFSFLAKIENEHYLSIKNSIFYLEDPEGWYDEMSHAGRDGA